MDDDDGHLTINDEVDAHAEATGMPRPAWSVPWWDGVCCPGCGECELGPCTCINRHAEDPEDVVTCDGHKWWDRETWLADKTSDEVTERFQREFNLDWKLADKMASTAVRITMSWRCEEFHAAWKAGPPIVDGISWPWIAELDGVE